MSEAPDRIVVLHLEDDPKDSRLINTTLAADGLDCEILRVETEDDFRLALTRGGLDLILADHSLPTFDGLSALAIAREVCPDVPFICVSGSLGEELAIEALKSGATDYVLKKRLSRLVPAVRRALQESAERAKRRRAEAEVRALEEQLRHSQKLEAIGQLAGGIAHDFNNLLTVINGYCDRLLAIAGDGSPIRADLDLIQKAGRRATALTTQLLAFSRRQVLQPRVIELNAIVLDVDKMLKRVIGEQITTLTALDPELGAVHADPGQIELVILNLAINARDAMLAGGTLTIETANVEVRRDAPSSFGLGPGQYVSLVVRDTGHGMDDRTLSRVFEPFFTTKEVGKGTGLGLPTVYGIVKQSGGEVGVESTLGHGTTVRVFLPRVEGGVAAVPAAVVPSTVARGLETVLLVEDEDLVRELVREFLESAGYEVLEAHDAEDAVRLARAAAHPIDLLVTDIVLPGMNGPDLAKRLREIVPRLRALYVSGYPGDAMFRQGAFEPGLAFLAKPFTRHVLTQRVREILDQAPPAAGAVLVLDEDVDIRRLLTEILHAAGYVVFDELANVPRDAAGRRQIDAVLVDLAWNDAVRTAVIDALRRELPASPVVLMAGAFGSRLLEEADGLGVSATLQKPLNEQSVLDAVARALRARRGPAAVAR
jgi:two-component system cell cycle sensor histidine kinase/response regulator CckA